MYHRIGGHLGGVWGLSTGLDYPPGAYASTEELVSLSETVNRLGGIYHTHTRASLLSHGHLAPWEEAVEIGRRSGIPVHLTHYRQGAQGLGSHLDYLGLVESARDEGIDVTFDCYTYPYSGTTITIGLPSRRSRLQIRRCSSRCSRHDVIDQRPIMADEAGDMESVTD